jgi:hypothetical protein
MRIKTNQLKKKSLKECREVTRRMQHADYFKTRLCKPVKNEIALKSFDTPDPHALGEYALKADRLAKSGQRRELGKCCLCGIKKPLGCVHIIQRNK